MVCRRPLPIKNNFGKRFASVDIAANDGDGLRLGAVGLPVWLDSQFVLVRVF